MSDFQNDVIDRLARIEENQKTELEYRRSHGRRITALERWRWYVGGAVAVLLGLLGYATKGGGHG